MSYDRNREDDSRVFVAIENGHDRNALIVESLRVLDNEPETLYRRVDRALRRLRKAGRIVLCGRPRRWKTAKQAADGGK